MFRWTIVILAFFSMTISADSANAASEVTWEDRYYNPKPLDGDVVLPMPCGGAMTFRRVPIRPEGGEGPLSDLPVSLGDVDETKGYAESLRPAYVAGSFTAKDGDRYFLMGKYEVNQLQYQALSGSCPEVSRQKRLPQDEVAWIDAVRAADAYSTWILANAFDEVPIEEEQPGFVRLPTEAEWEFAARGGNAVSPSEFRERSFPMPDGKTQYVWFAGTKSANGKPRPIGLLAPNPLGLHDILGNLGEIVFDPFRLSKVARLHGQAGGYVVRGGNFFTDEADIRSSHRVEVPFYRDARPWRSKTTGFRLAVVAPVITSKDRLRQIEADWSKLGAQPSASGETESPFKLPDGEVIENPVEELGALADAAGDEALKDRLQNLQLAFRESFQARDEQRDRAAGAAIRLGAFLCKKLHDDGGFVDALKQVYERCVSRSGAESENCVNRKNSLDGNEAVLFDTVRYYADTVKGAGEDYGQTVLDQQLTRYRNQLVASDVRSLIPFAEQFHRQSLQMRREKRIERTRWFKECKDLDS
jgi:hypothetical protein